MTCWNILFQQSAKLNVAQRHAIHPQTLNLQRKHTPVNILTYNRIIFTLQQNQKRLKKRTLKWERKMKVMRGLVILC